MGPNGSVTILEISDTAEVGSIQSPLRFDDTGNESRNRERRRDEI